jgi:hypothetical protein
VTSPDIGDNPGTLLGVVQAESSKGSLIKHMYPEPAGLL